MPASMSGSFQIRKPSQRELVRKRFLFNQRRITVAFVMGLGFMFSLGFLYLYQSNQLVALVNQREKLLRDKAELEKIRDSLMQEEVRLSSLQRIEFLAREQLGMIVPGREHRLELEKP